jgi:hypothetical protein
MTWLGKLIAGPMLWAFVFSLVYGLHGWVCAGQPGPEGLPLLSRSVLIGVWVLGLLAFIPLLRLTRPGEARHERVPRLATWTGLVATIFTLFPVVMITSC